jgi:filamentous hemagglutinin
MNRQLHRVIFNAVRGMRMVTQETARSTGKGSSKATSTMACGAPEGASTWGARLAAIALAGMLATLSAQSQIVGAPNVPGNLRPTVLVAPNGVPLVNIRTPSVAGVSRNVYNAFNVGANGAILNNSRGNVQTQLGGFVQGNPNLATGSARIIVNEVNGGNPSLLRGYLEVAGQRAEIIIANPAGISVDGGGFINASKATLTTGTPQFNAIGGLDSFVVRGGTVSIDGAGLDARRTDYAAILARAVQVNAGIWASELKVVTGANQIGADHAQIAPATGAGATPAFALDVSRLGGMFAHHIFLKGTEAGLGVRNAGNIGASAGQLVVTTTGRLENTGTLEGTRVEIAGAGDIDNRGGTIRQTSGIGLVIASPTLSNTNGGVIGVERLPASTTGGADGGAGATTGGTSEPGAPANGSGSGGAAAAPVSAPAPVPFIPTSPGALTATGAILNDGGKIYAGGPIALQTPRISNAGGALSVASMAVIGPDFSNAGGTLHVSDSFSANVGRFDNTGGKLNAGALNIATSNDLLNNDGVLASATHASLTVGGKADNLRGSISAAGALGATVAGAMNNSSGTLTSNEALTLDAGSLDNTQGRIQSAQAGVRLGVTHALDNGGGGSIQAASDLGIRSGSLANGGSLRGGNDADIVVVGAMTNDGSVTARRHATIAAGSVRSSGTAVLGAGIRDDGKLGGAGDLRVTAAGALVANGTSLAAGDAVLQGASVDLSGSQTHAADITITATQGNVVTTNAAVTTPGTLAIGANGNATQTLVNDAGKLGAARLRIEVSNIANTNQGEIVQTGNGVTRIVASGAIDNSGGTLASNGGFDLVAASLSNRSGILRAAQASDLVVTVAGFVDNRHGEMSAGDNAVLRAGRLDNENGSIAAAGDVSSTTSEETTNRSGTMAANGRVTLNAASLDNTGGKVSALDSLTASVQGAVNNASGTLVADRALVLDAGSLANDKGAIQSTQASTRLNVSGALANGSGFAGGATDLRIEAGSLSNAGSLRAGNNLAVAVAGLLANDGNITAGHNTTIAAGSVQGGSSGVVGAGIQSDGKLGAAGDLVVSVSGALLATGTHLAAGNATLQGASVDLSKSQASAASIALVATQGDVTTSRAKVLTAGTLAIRANGNAGQALVNDAGLLSASRLLIDVSNLANTNGGEIVQTGLEATTIAMGGTLNNDGGRLASNGRDLSLRAGAITNKAGTIEHAGSGALDIVGGSFDGTNGRITTNNALTVEMSGAFDQGGGTTSAKRITIDAGSLDNRGGQILQTGTDATRIAVAGTLDNGNAGAIASNGDTTIVAGSLSNRGGSIRAAQAAGLAVNVSGLLDNSDKGSIGAGGDVAVRAGSLANDAGSLTAVGNLDATVSGVATNVGGTLAANGNTTLTAASLDNSAGTAAAVNGNLSVMTTGPTLNVGGMLQAGGGTTLSTGGFVNRGGKVFGKTLSVDTHDNTLDNSANGTMAATATVVIRSGTLLNDAGLVQSGGAMTLDTNGRSLSNTNAAGHGSKQGGIVSAGTLTLDTGALDNAAGFIGAKNALAASTRDFYNTQGGIVLGQSSVAVVTHGATYDNSGGKTQAVGDLRIEAADVRNSGGLVRSAATTTLRAGTVINTTTQGQDQGIEGRNVVVDAINLDNNGGAIRADVDVTIGSSGTVSNRSGLISAGDTLVIVDPHAANPGAKTLNLINTDGTLVADKGLKIDAAAFSGDGKVVSGKDLRLALTQDIVNNGEVAANGDLSYTTTGHLTNNGKLLAGQTLTVGGNTIDNTANAEMSGQHTVVQASGTLTNRGLIDSRGTTRIDAGVLTNTGTGRIYGDAVSIGAGTLDNAAETVAGVTKAGTIAARGDLNIGAANIRNREHALIFSQGNMSIGGALDAERKATGQGAVLDNLSADIESIGNMRIAMAQVNNRDVHIRKGTPTVTPGGAIGIAPTTPVGSGIGRTAVYPLDEVNIDAVNGLVFRKDTGELVGIGGYGIWQNVITITEDTAVDADPARLVAGGNMNVDGRLYNENSQVLAGGTITATSYQSSQLSGTRSVVGSATVIDNTGQLQTPVPIPIVIPPQTISLGGYKYQSNLNATTGYDAGTAPVGGATGGAAGTGNVSGGNGPGAIVEVAASVGEVIKTDGRSVGSSAGTSGPGGTAPAEAGVGTTTVAANGSAQGTASSAQAGASRTIPMVVRTSAPSTGIPNASLFSLRTSGGYLIETDPRFANYRNWLGSDYLLNNLGLDPNNTLKRLGDGFYEQKLIREQVAKLTGYRYLEGFSNDDDQYTALMNAGATFARQYGLRPGVALSAAQMAQLTSDIVWLVEQAVTLPDGSTQRVLVPQVYVRVRPGDIDGSGALLSADTTVIEGQGDLVNTGTIAGRSLVRIDAGNVGNLGGRIDGGAIGINARDDLSNIGGSITARDAAVLTAGRDIDIRTTTSTAAGNTAVDRVAGVYVTNPGGTLVASAGRDANLVAAALVSAGDVSVDARRNIDLGTVTEGHGIAIVGRNGAGIASESREVGSVVQGQGNVRLAAGNDLRIRAGAVASTDGALVATATNDIDVSAGQATSSVSTATQRSSKSLLRKSSSSTFDSTTTTEVLSSSLSGKSVVLVAGNDVNLQAAQLRSEDATSLSAGRDINLSTASRSTVELHAAQSRSSGTVFGQALAAATFAGDPTAVAIAGNKKSSNSAGASVDTQTVGTQISAGSLQAVSGRDIGLKGATIVADKDVTLMAGRDLRIESAQGTRVENRYDASSSSGMIGQWYNPAIGNVKGSQANATTGTTQQASQVASLQGNVTLVAGNEYRQTASSVLAAGQAGALAGGDVNILAKNVVINEAYDTTQSVTLDRRSSTIVGGSASVMGVGTDTLKGGSSTIRAMGDIGGGDGRLQALGTINLAMSGKQAYDNVSALANGGQLSYGVSVNVSRNSTESTSFTNNAQAVGSGIVGANNVNIVSTGRGKDSNIRVAGSTIAAGKTVNLTADNDITLEASKSESVAAGQNSSRGANVGVTVGAGAQNGVSFQLGVNSGKGKNNQSDVGYSATSVSGGRAVNVSSGGDLNMRGGIIEANRIAADVGRNLNIESLQDVSIGQSRQSSSGLNVSLCIPPICGGVSTVGGSAAGAKADGVFVSPNAQAGIKAGDGGFDVKVKGDTNLVGAVIKSTQAAVDDKKNRFDTGGALTTRDLQNLSQSSGSSYSVSGGVGFMAGGASEQQAAMRMDRNMSESQVAAASNSMPSGSAGGGSYGSSQSSVTKSGISGIAGDQGVRTGDSSGVGTLVKDWNTQDIVKNVQAQAQLTQQFNQNAAREIGTYAGNRAIQLRDRAQAETDPGRRQLLLSEARQWDEGGAYRMALHTAAGALGGGIGGALGAGVSATLMPRIAQAIEDMNLPGPVAQALGAISAAAIGGIVGGTTGAASAYGVDINNRQLHPAETRLIKDHAKEYAARKGISVADAEKELAAQAFRQVQFGAPGAWDKDANAFLQELARYGQGQNLPLDPAFPQAGPGYYFQATPAQKVNAAIYLNEVIRSPQALQFYRDNNIQQPTIAQIAAAASKDQGARSQIAQLTIQAAALAGGLALAPGLSGVAAEGYAFAQNPVAYCTLNPAACIVGADIVAATVSGVPVTGAPLPNAGSTARTLTRVAESEAAAAANAARATAGNVETVANAIGAQRTITAPSAAGRTVATMGEAVSGNPIAATQAGTVKGADICVSGCAIGGLTQPEQQLVTRIRNGEDSAGGNLTEQLLTSVSQRTGMTVLAGGKYGSNNGFDLVLQDAAGNVTVIMDAKQITQAGSIKLSTDGAKGTNQLSPDWIRSVLNALPQNSPTRHAIQQAINNNALTVAVGGVNRTTGQLIVAPVTVPNKQPWN